jgi:uncharacterized protein (DUF952 family)
LILHITTPEAWAAALDSGAYRSETLDTEGFIHCSRPHQLVATANRRYRGRTDLVLLSIDPALVPPDVPQREEGGFPHLYGPLPVEAVTSVVGFDPGADGRFHLPGLRNLGFEDGLHGWTPSGDGFAFAADPQVAHGGRHSGRIASEGSADAAFGTLTQCLEPELLLGTRVRWSGWLRTDRVSDGFAGLWLRVDGPGDEVLAFDNMHDREIVGTTPWSLHHTVLDVPKGASGICFGAILAGQGTVWVDDVDLEVLGPSGSGVDR